MVFRRLFFSENGYAQPAGCHSALLPNGSWRFTDGVEYKKNVVPLSP